MQARCILHAMQAALILTTLIPLAPVAAGLVGRRLAAESAGRLALGAALVSLVGAVAAGVVRWFGAADGVGPGWLWLDGVSWVMAVLVSFVGATVIRYSRNHLLGDPAQAVFFSWLSLTLGSVLLMVLSGHLLVLWAAWVATSLCLHRLLLHRPERPGAVFSARKKFVFSRLGDVCLLAAVWLLSRGHGTLWMDELFASVEAGNTAGLPVAGYLMALCAVLKSAQFPFHSWLPDTMETPTPVSAFMHAGIVNAGGFLVIRMAPVFEHAAGALAMLAVFGTLTAAFGAVVMLAQPGVKRALACSTVAQMGFMMMQCGFGAYGLAMFHLVAHSLYKAHAFLTAGSTVGVVPRMAVRLGTPQLVGGLLVGGLLAAGAVGLGRMVFPGVAHGPPVFVLVLALALAYGLGRAWSAASGIGVVLGSLGASALVAVVGVVFHSAAGHWFRSAPPDSVQALPTVLAAAVFGGLFLFQILLWRAGRGAVGRSLYVHALNGFYVGTIANRLLGRLWPRQSSF